MIMGCAKSVSPPGGPEDKTPPIILVTEPVSGSVEVPLDSRIEIRFSESIDRQTAEKAVFISPLPDPEPKIKIKNDAIVIIPEAELQPDRTYVVTIGTDLKDAHRVNLKQSVSLAFSTGMTIDSGSIKGTVFREGKGTPGISLALFEDQPERFGLPIDSIAPEYITQSGDAGLFTFDYLPHDTFYLVAFEDKNKNRRINPEREMIGVPFTSTVIDSTNTALTGIGIQLHLSDPSFPGLRSVSINPDRLLKLRFDQKLDSLRAGSLISIAVLAEESDSGAVREIYEYTNLMPYPTGDYVLVTEPLSPEKKYKISFDLRALYPQIPDSLQSLTYSFAVPEGEDKNPPVLLESFPADGAVNLAPDPAFVFRFSEPIDTIAALNAIRLINASQDTTEVAMVRQSGLTLTGRTMAGLEYGQSYQLLLDPQKIRDLSGNLSSDSSIIIGFSTIGLDTLGQLSGEIQFADQADAAYPVELMFKPAGEGQSSRLSMMPGQQEFSIDLIPGYYTISAFIDRNRNGSFDYGSIIPYQLAEPFKTAADTFRVRTRFESSGVLLEF